MSFYNLFLGEDFCSDLLLNILNIPKDSIPRYRDAYLNGENIVIYTRTGGGNRLYYDSLDSCKKNYPEYFNGQYEKPGNPPEIPKGPWNEFLRDHPCYLFDKDDELDCTYAKFHFKYPEEYIIPLKELEKEYKSLEPEEKFNKLMKSIKGE